MSRPLRRSEMLRGERVLLRAPQRADAEEIFRTLRIPGFTAGMLYEPPESVKQTREALQESLERWDQGRGYAFTVVNLHDQSFLGRVSLRQELQVRPGSRWRLGFWIVPGQQRQGIATEAGRLALNFAFERLETDAVVATAAAWNTPSLRVLEKLGFVQEEVRELGFYKAGHWHSEVCMVAARPSQR